MDSIHTPSVSSGQTSTTSPSQTPSQDKTPLLDLIAEKDRVESELSALISVLESVTLPLHIPPLPSPVLPCPLPRLTSPTPNPSPELTSSPPHQHNVTMTTTLTTFDGFPRSDLDVAQSTSPHPPNPSKKGADNNNQAYIVRTTRARIIHLRNDYKALMTKIETGLHAHHAEMRSNLPTAAAPEATKDDTENEGGGEGGLIETPFARVNSVVDGSPADAAGLKAGDRVRSFGTVNWMNHEKLAKVAEVVQRSEGVRHPFPSYVLWIFEADAR